MLNINTAIDDGFKTAEYLGLSDWMPKEDVQDYSDRTDNLNNAMSLIKGGARDLHRRLRHQLAVQHRGPRLQRLGGLAQLGG